MKTTVEVPEERTQVEEEDVVEDLTLALEDLSTSEVKGEKQKPTMAKPEMNKLALFMEDMNARMKAMEQYTATLEEQLDKDEENVHLRETSQKAETKADRAINYAADVSKSVTDNLVAPKPLEAPPSKL